MKKLALLLAVALGACAPQAPTAQPVMVRIHASAAAAPWLDAAFTCAGRQAVVLNVVADPEQADLSLRIGEPPALEGSAYQIDTEEILILTNRESPVQSLDTQQARALFARGGDSIQVWVYAPGEDVQQAFDRLLMGGAGVTSLARLAATPQEMLDALNAQADAVGILPGRWKAGAVREVYSAGSVPVLVLPHAEPQGAIAQLIECLQK